jgi:cobalt-zinc-cadmium efflux system membrane fusion protein
MKKMFALLAFAFLIAIGCTKKGAESAPDEAKLGETQGGAAKDALVEMSLTAQKHVGLEVAPVAMTRLKEYLKVTGTIQPIDKQVGQVGPLTSGRILSVRAKVGDRVEAGQTLATIDNPEAGELIAQNQSANADLEKLKAQLVPATRQTERARHLADIGAGAEKDYEFSRAEQQGIEQNIRAQQALINGLHQRLRRFGISNAGTDASAFTPLRSPFAGVVVKAQASPGDVVDAGRDLFTVADLSRVWVQAEVYDKDLGRIRTGQDAAITVATYPNQTFSGRVTYISDVLDPQTRTARVRCEVANRRMLLKTDMFADVQLPTTFSKQAIAVPTPALQTVDGKNVVFVRRSPTQFEKREVDRGVAVNGLTEIVRGLKSGEPVVVQGAFHLKSIIAGGSMGDND